MPVPDELPRQVRSPPSYHLGVRSTDTQVRASVAPSSHHTSLPRGPTPLLSSASATPFGSSTARHQPSALPHPTFRPRVPVRVSAPTNSPKAAAVTADPDDSVRCSEPGGSICSQETSVIHGTSTNHPSSSHHCLSISLAAKQYGKRLSVTNASLQNPPAASVAPRLTGAPPALSHVNQAHRGSISFCATSPHAASLRTAAATTRDTDNDGKLLSPKETQFSSHSRVRSFGSVRDSQTVRSPLTGAALDIASVVGNARRGSATVPASDAPSPINTTIRIRSKSKGDLGPLPQRPSPTPPAPSSPPPSDLHAMATSGRSMSRTTPPTTFLAARDMSHGTGVSSRGPTPAANSAADVSTSVFCPAGNDINAAFIETVDGADKEEDVCSELSISWERRHQQLAMQAVEEQESRMYVCTTAPEHSSLGGRLTSARGGADRRPTLTEKRQILVKKPVLLSDSFVDLDEAESSSDTQSTASSDTNA